VLVTGTDGDGISLTLVLRHRGVDEVNDIRADWGGEDGWEDNLLRDGIDGVQLADGDQWAGSGQSWGSGWADLSDLSGGWLGGSWLWWHLLES
jgi:hypothetical protein